jgi:hypothetical protein
VNLHDNDRKRWLLFVPVGLVLLVFIFFNLSAIATPFPKSCQFCHATAYAGWSASPHKDTDCNNCHQDPGLIGQVSWRLRVLSMSYSLLTGNRNAAAQVKQKACLGCHNDIQLGAVSSDGLTMSHTAVIQGDPSCGECHKKSVHGKGTQYKFASMDKCLTCHLEEGADTSCLTCHVGKMRPKRSEGLGPWQVAHGRKWRTNHGLLDLALCPICHSSQYCVRCHKISDLPHSPGWLNVHGKVAKNQRDDCFVCHNKTLCQGCHKTEMPHNSKWLSEHPAVANKQGKKICLNCHLARACDDCHAKHVHPVELKKVQDFFKQGLKWGGFK